MHAYVLCENSVFRGPADVTEQGWDLLAEHGWSVYISTKHGNYLLDTGLGQTVLHNADRIGVDLSALDGIILSHNHLDHTGGLKAVLQRVGRPIPVYCHPDLFKKSVAIHNGQEIDTGIPYSREELEELGARFVFNTAPYELFPGAYLTGEIPRVSSFELQDPGMLVVRGEQPEPDPLLNDQSLVIRTEDGLFVVLGCAHAGIINTLEHAIALTGETRIHTLIGGTHLGPIPSEQREATLKALPDYDISHLGASHCTGIPVMARLAGLFGPRFFPCTVGTHIVLGE